MYGCGMAMQQYVIVACEKCHRLSSKYLGVVSNFDEAALNNKRCSHCRSRRIELYEIPEVGPGVCPRCGKQSLYFADTMLWD